MTTELSPLHDRLEASLDPCRELYLDTIIETHLDHVHRGGPAVDLTALPADLADDAGALLEVVDLLIEAADNRQLATR